MSKEIQLELDVTTPQGDLAQRVLQLEAEASLVDEFIEDANLLCEWLDFKKEKLNGD